MKSLTVIVLATLLLSGCSSIKTFPGKVFDKFRSFSDKTAPNYVNYGEKKRTESVALKNSYLVAPQVTRETNIQATIKPAVHHPKATDKKKVTYKNPATTISKANQQARVKPNISRYKNAIMNYEFSSGALYQIYTAPLRITDIQLQPNEKIIGKPAAGDTVRWILGVNESIENGQTRKHILIKPTKSGLKTTLIINTNRRTYLLELASYKQTYMPAVNWYYPEDERRQAQQKAAQAHQQRLRQQAQQFRVPKKRNFEYKITYRWKKPKWTPVQVFDDGSKVYIRFPEARKNYEAPALFVVSDEGDTQLVNYRVKDDYYVIDRLFNIAELRVGQKKPTIVRISRLDS